MKALLEETFIALNAYIKISKRFQNKYLKIYLDSWKSKNKTKPQISKREEINEMEMKKTQRISKAKNWFFEKKNNADKPLAKPDKKTKLVK